MRISGNLCAFALCVFIVGIAYAETTDADKKTVASKAYVDTKQDIITTGLVSLGDDWFEDLPSVVSFDSTSGLVGNKYGILDVNGSMNYIDDLKFTILQFLEFVNVHKFKEKYDIKI